MFDRILGSLAFVRTLVLLLLVACLVAGDFRSGPREAAAQTPNLSVAVPGVFVMPFHVSGQYTATTAAVVRFALPFPAQLVSAQATARASGGTSPTLTVDVKTGGTTVLSAPIAVTAGSVAFGTVTTSALADEAAMTVDLTIGGTSPTWNDIVIVLTFVRA